MLRYSDVFVPGGFPQHTYNPRERLDLEERLAEVEKNLCKLVVVTGQTKSGKTVLTRKVLPPEQAVWVDGGSVTEEQDFWQIVMETLDLFDTAEVETSKESSGSITGTGKAGANFIIAKGEAELGGTIGHTRGAATRSGRTVSPRVAVIGGLRKRPRAVVVDDFHYIPKPLQASIVRALKPLIFDGLPVVIIAIPHRRYDAMKVEKEMTGRIQPMQIPAWTDEELAFIPQKGFDLLGYQLGLGTIGELAAQAIGSPHLMQDFCRGLCVRLRIDAEREPAPLEVDRDDLEFVFRDIAESIGRTIFEKLARGPRQRTDRIQRVLKDGSQVDIYELVLHALAHLRPGLVSLEYEDLRGAIRDVSAQQIPQLHEVSRVLRHMASIAANDQASTPVIDFEEDEQKLHITDPFFAFYLRWGRLHASE